METIRFQSQVDSEGKLQLQLNNLPADQALEIVVIYQPISSDTTTVTNDVEDDPIVGLFSASPDLAEQSENLLEKEIQNPSGWTWKS